MLAGIVVCLFFWWLWVGNSPTKPPAAVRQPDPLPPDPVDPVGSEPPIDIAPCDIETVEGRCAVCRLKRKARFTTPRIVLCQPCVVLLCDSAPIDVHAIYKIVLEKDAISFIERGYVEQVLNDGLLSVSIGRQMTAAQLQSAEKGHSKDWLKFLRAYHLGLISRGHALARPNGETWAALARSVRSQDGGKCRICGDRGVELHVHHMVHLRCYGSNDPRNLITLCYGCHRDQHPTHYFSMVEPDAIDSSEGGGND